MQTRAARIRKASPDGQRRDAILEQWLTDDSRRFQAKLSASRETWSL
jgi:hypothetical protein